MSEVKLVNGNTRRGLNLSERFVVASTLSCSSHIHKQLPPKKVYAFFVFRFSRRFFGLHACKLANRRL